MSKKARKREESTLSPESVERALDAAELRAALEREQRIVSERCSQEVQAVLQKHGCTVQFVEVRVNGQLVQTRWETVPLPPQQ